MIFHTKSFYKLNKPELLRISTCLPLLTALIGQPSVQQNIEEFGRKYFKSLRQNDFDLFLSLGYRAGEIIKTIDLKTESEQVRHSIKSEMKETFDIKIRNEMAKPLTSWRYNEFSA